jgi:hypothetical protein
MRYVTTERRGLSQKEPPPEGLRRRRPIGGVTRASDISETVHKVPFWN